jgi:hypothetical protein
VTTSDPLLINCEQHGEQVSAVICKHMRRTEPAPSGFIENSDDPNDLQAWCHQCEERFELQGGMTDEFKSFNDACLVCVPCYEEAKIRHTLAAS